MATIEFPVICPNCGEKMELATSATRDETIIHPGAVGMCARCFAFFEVLDVERHILRLMAESELNGFLLDLRRKAIYCRAVLKGRTN